MGAGGKSLSQEFLPAPFAGYHFLLKVSVGKPYLKNLGLHQRFPPPSLFFPARISQNISLKTPQTQAQTLQFQMFANKLRVRSLFPRSRGLGGGISLLRYPLWEKHLNPPGAQERDNPWCPSHSVCSPCQRHNCEREAILGRGVWAESSLESSLGINVLWLLTGRAGSSLALRGRFGPVRFFFPPSLLCLCILSFPFQWCVCTKA